MADITVDELGLLGFFGVEPTRLDADIPWPYNSFTYEVQCGETSVSFSLGPSYKDIHIILKSGATVFYELKAVEVDDVKYHTFKGLESIEVVISDRDRLWLSLYPNVSIHHEVSAQT